MGVTIKDDWQKDLKGSVAGGIIQRQNTDGSNGGYWVNGLNEITSGISTFFTGFDEMFSSLNKKFSLNKFLNILLIGLGLGLSYFLTRSVIKK